MKKITNILTIILCCAVMFNFAGCQNQSDDVLKGETTGMLIGLRTDHEDDTSTYRELWFVMENGSLKYKGESDSLLVPTEEGLIKIVPMQYKDPTLWYNAEINYLAAVVLPEDESVYQKEFKSYEELQLGSIYEDKRSTKILYLNRELAVLKISSNYALKGARAGGSYSVKTDVYVKKLKGFNDDENKVSISEIFGTAMNEEVDKIKEMTISTDELIEWNKEYFYSDFVSSMFIDSIKNATDDLSWGIMRNNRIWNVFIAKKWKGLDFNIYCTNYVPYFVQVPDNSIVTNNELSLEWDIIKSKIPEAEDAISSPEKGILAVFCPDSLYVYSNPSKSMNKPKFKIKLNENETLIMSEWISEEELEKWDEQLSPYFKK